MRRLAAALAVCFAMPVYADSIARQGDDWVRLTPKLCTNAAVLAIIPEQQHSLFRAASARFSGTDYAACWTPIQGGAGLVYEDGDQGFIPQGEAKAVPEA